MSLSSLEKVLRLATTDVRQYQRMEHGKIQTVHAHTEDVAGKLGNGWIAEPLWKEGQEKWEKAGEAAALRGRSEASVKAHDSASATASRDAKAKIAADRARRQAARDALKEKARNSPTAQARRERMSARSASLQERYGIPSGSAPEDRFSGGLQSRVEGLEQQRQRTGERVSQSKLFSAPVPPSTDKLLRDASTRAVAEAAARGGGVDQSVIDNIMAQMADMEDRITSAHVKKTEAAKAAEAVEAHKKDEGRAKLAINLLGILAGIMLIATTGGIGALVGEVMAFGWTVEVAKELATYHGVESGAHEGVNQLLAHPVRETGKLVSRAGQAVSRAVTPRPGPETLPPLLRPR